MNYEVFFWSNKRGKAPIEWIVSYSLFRFVHLVCSNHYISLIIGPKFISIHPKWSGQLSHTKSESRSSPDSESPSSPELPSLSLSRGFAEDDSLANLPPPAALRIKRLERRSSTMPSTGGGRTADAGCPTSASWSRLSGVNMSSCVVTRELMSSNWVAWTCAISLQFSFLWSSYMRTQGKNLFSWPSLIFKSSS